MGVTSARTLSVHAFDTCERHITSNLARCTYVRASRLSHHEQFGLLHVRASQSSHQEQFGLLHIRASQLSHHERFGLLHVGASQLSYHEQCGLLEAVQGIADTESQH